MRSGTRVRTVAEASAPERAPAYDHLAVQHRELDDGFARYEATGDEALLRDLCDLLTIHAEIEEVALYPELRHRVDGGDDLADDATNEHATMRTLVARILDSPPADLRPVVAELAATMREHAQFEEDRIFPEMIDCRVDAARLGQRLDAAERAAASRVGRPVG
jgi:hypothetical protein